MRQPITRRLLTYGALLGCLTAANFVHSTIAESRLVGLAMHQEIGRNIYIGAIHYDELVPRPDNLVGAAGPKVMEYRIIARRTSIRSLMGSILLQGELATGKPPSDSTIEFAGAIMAAVKGSLYAGDSLEIRLNKDASITATLDGLELARTDKREVSDYFLMGWVGERGPSSAFRSSIMNVDIDSSLMSIYSAHAVSQERLAVIVSWSTPLEEPAPEPTVVAQETATSNDIHTATTTLTPPPAEQELQTATVEKSVTTVQDPADEPIQLASLTLTREMIEKAPEGNRVLDAMDAREYSQRLAIFNTEVLHSVHAKIRYPRVAVRRNIQGALELDLSLDKDGNLLDVVVVQSSGHTTLDKSAVKVAADAFNGHPLAEIDPVALAEYSEDGNTLVIPIPVSFILTE